MSILCDTSSILMLFPVAPEMFVDRTFDCITIKDVHDELIQTQKFRTKYPWIRTCRPKLRIRFLNAAEKEREILFYKTVGCLCQAKLNKLTGKMFHLSPEDKKVISHTLAIGASISTGDNNISRFMKQEFPKDYGGELSALEVVISWIERGLITWTQEKQAVLEDWARNDEPVQPHLAKNRFRALTGLDYIGP